MNCCKTILAVLGLVATAQAAEPPITAVAFAPGGPVVAASQAGVRVLSWPDLKPQRKIDVALAHVHALSFSPAGDVLAVAGGTPAEEGTVELRRWPSGELLRRLSGHDDLVQAVAWNRDGSRVATASADGTCRVLDLATGKVVQTFAGHAGPVSSVCWLPGGKTIVSAGADQSLRVWDAASGRSLRALENHTGPVHALALRPGTPEGAQPVVATASSDRTLRLWQPAIGRMMKIKRLPSVPLSVAWSPNGSRLLAACADGRVRVIDPDTLELLAEEKAIEGWAHALAVPPAGRAVLIGGENGRLSRMTLPR